MAQYRFNPRGDFKLSTRVPSYPTPNFGGSGYGSDYIEPPKKRSMANRLFSPLNVFNYSIAGFVRGLQQDDLNPVVGALQGIYAANPLGQGNQDWQHSFSDVLDNTDWKPESFIGKGVKFATGMALDIFLDPMTYVSGGLGGVVKGSGKHSAEIATKGGKYLVNTSDVAEGIGLSIDTAEKIIKSSEVFKSGKYVSDIAEEASELVRNYNKLIGVNSKSAEVTLSLANAPFGKKIFGAAANSKKVIFTSEQVKAFGDATLAPHYGKVRDAVFGGKIGDMFSKQGKLYNASKDNPLEVFNYFKQIDLERGINQDKAKAIEKIFKHGTEKLNLTPAENKEVLELLEDPSKFSKVEKMIQFSETKEGKIYLDMIKESKLKAEIDLVKVSMVFDGVADEADSLDKLLNISKVDLDFAKKNIAEELLTLNRDFLQESGKLEEYNRVLDEISNDIFKNSKKPEEVVKNFKEYSGKVKQRHVDIDANKVLSAHTDKKMTITHTKPTAVKPSTVKFDISGKDFDDIFFKPEGIADRNHKVVKDRLFKEGQIVYRGKAAKYHTEQLFKKYPNSGLQHYINEAGEYVVVHKDLIKGLDIADYVSSFSPEMQETITRVDKGKVVDEISEYVFGQKGMINHNTWDNKLEEVVKLIDEGKTREHVGNYIYGQKDFFTGKSKQIYEFAAHEVGSYGSGKEFATWKEYFEEPMEKLMRKKKAGVELTTKEAAHFSKLKADEVHRKLIIDSFKDVSTSKEVGELISEIQTEKSDKLFTEFMESDFFKKAGTTRESWSAFTSSDRYSMNMDERWDVITQLNSRLGGASSSSGKVVKQPALEASNKSLEALESIFNSNHKVDGKLSPIGEIKFGYKKTLSEVAPKDIKRIIDDLGEAGFKSKFDLDTVTFKKLDHAVDKAIESGLRANIETSKLGLDTTIRKGSVLSESVAKDLIENIGVGKYRVLNDYADEVNNILHSKRMTFSEVVDFSDEQVELLLKQAMDNVNKGSRVKGVDELKGLFKSDKVKSISDKVEKIKPSKETIKKLDDIKAPEELTTNFYHRNDELLKQFDEELYKSYGFKAKDVLSGDVKLPTIDDLNAKRVDKVKQVAETYRDNYYNISDMTESLTKQKEELLKSVKIDADKMGELRKSVDRYENLINSNSAYETYVRASIGDDKFNSILNKTNEHVGKYLLDPDGKYSDTVRKVANDLRNSFIDMGVKEVEVGKLTKQQFEGLMTEYVPHMITDEAKALIESSSDVSKAIENFGAEYGFGRKFNPNSISRSITELTIDGKVVKNPTILQINEYFKPLLEGNDMFRENVAELYMARALTHTELMYDAEYMGSMLDLFGKEFTGVAKKGYDNVMNYGELKAYASDYAKKSSMIERSDMVSAYLKEDSVQQNIQFEITEAMRNSKFSNLDEEAISDMVFKKYIDSYVTKNFTAETNKAMYMKNLDALMDGTGTRAALDELHLPFVKVDKGQFDSMNTYTQNLKEVFEKNIRKSLKSLIGSDGEGFGDISDIKKHIEDIVSEGNLSDVKLDRYNGFLNKIESFESIDSAKVGQMQNSIVSKTNQMRELQIIKDNSDFLTMYDKFTHFMKLNQTVVLPGFHFKNKTGNTFRSWLGAGEDILNLDMQKGSFEAIKSAGEFAGEAFTLDGKSYTWSELFKKANELGVMDSNAFAKELGTTAGSKGFLGKLGVPGKFDPTNTTDYILYKTGKEVGAFTENQDRLLHFAAQVKNGMGFKEAADMSQKFLFDYSDLSFFEQNVMKRIFPYYTWIRKNTPLQLEMMLDYPEKFRNVNKVLGGIENMTPREDRLDKRWVNDFARDWIQLPFTVTNPDGRQEPVMLNPNLPTGGLNDIPDISDIPGTLRNYANKTNPIIKVPLEQSFNRHTYFDSPIVNPDSKLKDRIAGRLDHVANQFSLYPIGKGFAQKRGADLGLHTVNSASGIKALSYDYDKFKAMKMSELDKKRKSNEFDKDKMNSIKRYLGGW